MAVSITWIGHASFKIMGSAVVYIDPWKMASSPKDGDIVLVSHGHYDHYSQEDVIAVQKTGGLLAASRDVIEKAGTGRIVSPGDHINEGRVTVTGIPAYNVGKAFHPKENGWLGFIVELDGVRVYYSGDTDRIPEMADLSDINVALLPSGGTYTMDASEAATAANTIKPETAVPYHWGDIVGSKNDAEEFCAQASCRTLILNPGDSCSI